jgi:hypothetical protein
VRGRLDRLHKQPELGGMGLPGVVGTAINELFFGANMSLCLTTLLTREPRT